MKRIGHYAPRLWQSGGIANYVRRLGRAQAVRGVDVVYFSASEADRTEQDTVIVDGDADLFRHAEARALDVLHIHKPVDVPARATVPVLRTMHGNQGSCPSGGRYLARSGAPCYRQYSVAGCLISHVTQRCGSLKPEKLSRHFGGIRREIRLGGQVHTCTVSDYLRERMTATGYDPELLHTVHSPAPEIEQAYVPCSERGVPRIVFLGRLVPQKGLQWLLRALRLVKRPVHLDVGGTGPQQDALHAFCRHHGLEDRVTFHGWLGEAATGQLIRDARAVIVPSLWQEPAGLVTLEAAAYGRAVVASEVGGIPEYAREAFALRVPPNDDAGLADAIDALAGDAPRAQQLGAAGYDLAQTEFTMSRFLEALNDIYRQAIQHEPVLR